GRVPMGRRNLTGQNKLHASEQGRGGSWLTFEPRIHEHQHTTFGLPRADQLPRPEQVWAQVRIAPEIWPCLALRRGRQHGPVLSPQGRQPQGFEGFKESLKCRLTRCLCSVMHNSSSSPSATWAEGVMSSVQLMVSRV